MLSNISPATLLARLIVLIIAFPIHELAHAWSADQLGDDTPRRNGRLSLNPIDHLDPLGSLMLLVSGFGWAKPVRMRPNLMRGDPRTGMALSALAGPASNLLVAMLCAVPFRLGALQMGSQGLLHPASLLREIAGISVALALFNLLPLYPLDGEKVLAGVLPEDLSAQLLELRPFSPYILMALVVTGVVHVLIGLAWQPVIRLLFYV